VKILRLEGVGQAPFMLQHQTQHADRLGRQLVDSGPNWSNVNHLVEEVRGDVLDPIQMTTALRVPESERALRVPQARSAQQRKPTALRVKITDSCCVYCEEYR
jgi:hypothetical protein